MTIVRELGFMEARMHLLHFHFSGSTQGGLALRIEGELDPVRLRAALVRVQERYDILSCTIEERDGVLCFVRTDPPVELSVREVDDDDAWQGALGEINDEPLGAATLWRVAVLSRARPAGRPVHDLLLFVHHAIMDGTAADTFLEAVLREYVEPGYASAQPRMPVPVAAEAAVPPMLRLDWEAYTAWLKGVQAAQPVAAPLPYAVDAGLAARRTVFDTLEIGKAETASLEARAKAAGSTLNSWLSALLVQSTGAHMPGRDSMALHSTFSLRRLCAASIVPDDITCCMAIITTRHGVPATDVAALAVEHHAAVAKAVLQQTRQPAGFPLEQVRAGLLPLAGAAQFALDVAFTFGESRLKGRYGSLRLVHLYPIVNRRAGNLALAVHGVRLGGHCYLTFNHTAPLQTRAWADGVRGAFADALQHQSSFSLSRAMEPTE